LIRFNTIFDHLAVTNFLGHPVDQAMCVVLRCMQFSIIYTYIRTSLSRHIGSTTTSYNRTRKQVQI